ncbi:MAG: acetoin utilization protein AcuC [Candidatus Nanopelagicales bacterium]|nr:acetoin utilization protein AcuC [Candidatus Nanopelagicales bacterium]
MTGQLSFIWDERLRAYDFGSGHPLSPLRVRLAHQLTRDLGVLDLSNVETVGPVSPASNADLARVHLPEYIAAVERASAPGARIDPSHGIGTEDVPRFDGMHEASALVAGATLAAARAVYSKSSLHAVNLAGGLHHAMPGYASGFCVYNDIGVAIAWLLEQGVRRIGYVDVDVHHGDGVQAMFFDDPRVMTMSLHEDPRVLFPGSGYPDEIGAPGAEGTSINVVLPAGTRDAGWLRAFDAVVPEALSAFEPEILVTQQGCDTHYLDPLADLGLSIEGQRASYQRLHALAHHLCDGRWVAVGGGGYEWVDVVPRAWAHLTAIAAGSPIDPDSPVPESFSGYIKSHLGRPGPELMGDGYEIEPVAWTQGYDLLDPLDMSILRTREAVFGHLGLAADPCPLWPG